MNELRRLLTAENLEYPPKKKLWNDIINIVHKKTDQKQDYEAELKKITENLTGELNKYKPNLPEPSLSRLLINGIYYYMDTFGKIYEIDSENPLVGNLVGQMDDNFEITIKRSVVAKIPINDDILEHPTKEGMFYKDKANIIYKGFNKQLLYKVGKLVNDKIVYVTD